MIKGVRSCRARRARRNRGFNPKKRITFYLYMDLLTLLSYLLIIPRRSRRYKVLASSVRPSVPSVRPSTLFVCPEPYLSTYWSDLIHFWYK